MRPYRARFREQGAFFAFQSWASCIINIFGLDLRQAQGCAPFAHGSEGRAYSSPSNPGRAASPIYSDLICDRHSLLDNYCLPGDLERQIGAFVEDYNTVRYHESLNNLTRPTSTSAGLRQSWPNANVLSAQLSQTVACS